MALPSIENLDDKTKDQLASIALAMSSNNDTRGSFLKLFKKVSPETPIPEVDQQAAIDAAIAGEREAREKVSKDFLDYKGAQEMAAKKTHLRTEYGLSDDDIGKMEKMIADKQLPADYEFAAKMYQQQITPAEPTLGNRTYGPMDMPQDEGLLEDENRWSLTTAHNMIDAMQKTRRPAF